LESLRVKARNRKFLVVVYVHLSTTPDMPSLSPDPGFEYYYKACRKGDPEARAVAVSYTSAVGPAKAENLLSELPGDTTKV